MFANRPPAVVFDCPDAGPAHPAPKTLQRLNILNIGLRDRQKAAVSSATTRLSNPAGATKPDRLVEDHDAVFAALADPTRRAMLTMLSAGECSVGTLAAPHAMSLAGAAKHVAILERAGLIRRRRDGRRHLCRLHLAGLRGPAIWLARFYTDAENAR